MAAHIVVTYADGTTATAKPTPLAEVLTERKFGISADALTTFEQLYYMAWCALRQSTDDVPGDYDAWLGTTADISVEAVEESGPTKRGRRPVAS